MITYNEALQLFLNHAHVAVGTETVPTLYAEGRVLAEDVVSSLDVPAWDNSQMDGYAVFSEDLALATPETPVDLPVSQRIPAGSSGQALLRGTTARIFTGAPIPPQADAVVAQEDVTVMKTVPFASSNQLLPALGCVVAPVTLLRAALLPKQGACLSLLYWGLWLALAAVT